MFICFVCTIDRESEAYASEIEEPDWSVRQKQEKEEKRARQSLIADEFKKRRGNRPSTSMVCQLSDIRAMV